MNDFSGNLHSQTLLGPLSSADRLANYLYEEESRHFGESIADFQPGDEAHIFAHVLNHRISRGDATRVSEEYLNALLTQQWLPQQCKVTPDGAGYFLLNPIT